MIDRARRSRGAAMRRDIPFLGAVCILALGALVMSVPTSVPANAQAQADKWDKPIDLKPLIPSFISPLPPKSQLNPGTVGGADNPYTTAPLQNPTRTPTQQAP